MSIKSKMRGFTLIELLVVIFILSLLTGIFIHRANFKNPEAEARSFMVQLSSYMRLARLNAILQSKVLGLKISDSTILFYQWNAEYNKWVNLADNNKFWAAKHIPPSLEFKLELKEPIENGVNTFHPDILFLPDGNITAFVFSLYSKQMVLWYTLEGIGGGSLQVIKAE